VGYFNNNKKEKMKNKLLLSSALLGSLVIGSSSYAQTTVTGSISLSLKSLDSYNSATNATGAGRSFGRESQLNIQNKGKLNNGMDYAAGFSFEQDGGQTGDFSDENVYVDFISGDTTFTIGQDHIQNTNRTKGVLLGNDAFDLAAGNNYSVTTALTGVGAGFIQSAGANPAQAMGVGIVQKTPFGSVSALYVPTNGNSGSDDTVANLSGTNSTILESDRESAFEIGFEGNLGVKGLAVHYFYNEEGKNQGQTRDLQGINYGASYNMGQITAGYNRKETEFGASTLIRKQNEFGLAFAATPNLTLAANYTVVDSNAASAVEAKSKSIGIGYNLGPVAVVGQLAKMENITNTAGTGDVDVAFVRVQTNF
jgi:hypothetical protein